MAQSRMQFGREAQLRYEHLLNAAMQDLAADPQRPGARQAESGSEGLWLYHSRLARPRLPAADRVGRPRHILVYRIVGEEVRIIRVLHDAMDLPAHLEDI
jgi:toxin ParE1/3/4